MRTAMVSLIAMLLMSGAIALPAQVATPITPGSRVKLALAVTARPEARRRGPGPDILIGELVALTDSTVTVRKDAMSGDVTVPLPLVYRLQVSTGRSRSESARRGAVVGAAVGAVVGFAKGEDCGGDEYICFPRPATAFVGASAGASLGWVIGFVARRTDVWRDIPRPARVSIVPTGSGSLRVSSTLRF